MSERKLASGHKRVIIEACAWSNTPGILMPNGNVVPEAEAPDSCFAPEPKPPEFRRGDFVRRTASWSSRDFMLVVDPAHVIPSHGVFVKTRTGSGEIYLIPANELNLAHRCPPTPTGPIRVGSTVGYNSITLSKDEMRGIVTGVGDKDSGFCVIWQDGIQSWYKAWQLIHIASSDNHEQ